MEPKISKNFTSNKKCLMNNLLKYFTVIYYLINNCLFCLQSQRFSIWQLHNLFLIFAQMSIFFFLC